MNYTFKWRKNSKIYKLRKLKWLKILHKRLKTLPASHKLSIDKV
jgi:hypothetical protein